MKCIKLLEVCQESTIKPPSSSVKPQRSWEGAKSAEGVRKKLKKKTGAWLLVEEVAANGGEGGRWGA